MKKKSNLIIIGILPYIYTIISLIINNNIDVLLAHLPFLNFLTIPVLLKGEGNIETIGILIEGIFQIIGLIFITIGILKKEETKIKDSKKTIKNYIILKVLGYILFILSTILTSSIIYIFRNDTTENFIFFILFGLSLLWPIMYVGLILVIKSNQKLKELNKIQNK